METLGDLLQARVQQVTLSTVKVSPEKCLRKRCLTNVCLRSFSLTGREGLHSSGVSREWRYRRDLQGKRACSHKLEVEKHEEDIFFLNVT